MTKNGKDTKHTRHISIITNFVRNGEKCKMHIITIPVDEKHWMVLFIHGFPSTLLSFRTTLVSFWIDSFHVLRTFKLIESNPKLNLV